MSYESIAELVHGLVKNPNSILPAELKTNEFTIIQRVFSEYKVCGDIATFGTLPLGFWA
ncbi:hypothetical protein [Desulfosporosinus metallidurans]|uniref:Uncharacterized protein n=1 Tax=Desulfosporosinus metallidurans TaxID=1888891 RepID=A0A1Q8QE27_9FIRM|nr:hypothetical protein [Desulfosporosinus metallidurans]OLN25545.1 hypothetical protein DSOL_5292 [Desulfosporosinus metallidurans]